MKAKKGAYVRNDLREEEKNYNPGTLDDKTGPEKIDFESNIGSQLEELADIIINQLLKELE